jgi:ribulose-phosphate 3-epimerase
MPAIVPSLFAADHGALKEAAQLAYEGGARQFHIDIMDGVFVPQVGFSFGLVRSLRYALPDAILHVHMMVSNPQFHVEQAVEAGATSVTFHLEATPHSEALLQKIRSLGVLAGVALNPGTPVALEYLKHTIDMVLVMTCNPGHDSQIFLPSTLEKVRHVTHHYPDVIVAVDGMIDSFVLPQVCSTGAHLIVCGKAVYCDDPRFTVPRLTDILLSMPSDT